MIPVHNYLIVSALGIHRPETISELSRTCLLAGCNILNIKTHILGRDLAIMLYLAGNWGAIAKIEAILPSMEPRLGLAIQARRTNEASFTGQFMTYTIQVTAIDRNGILNGISDFLLKFATPIEEVSAHTYLTHTGTRMASLQLKIHVPENIHFATLREQFMSYCDDHNLDGFLEPARPI